MTTPCLHAHAGTRGPGRRRLMGASAALALPAGMVPRGACQAGSAASPSADGELAEWRAFRARYLLPEGRIVDTGNNGVSHSEGQGWGLFFAATVGDRDAFDRMLGWTRHMLHRRDDGLHAWRYAPYEKPKVSDTNNATDGDLFIAAALARAARRWGSSAYEAAGAMVARDVLRLLVRDCGGRTVLLPGAAGFERPAALVVNPSYYAFPALVELAGLVPSPRWVDVWRDGVALIEAGRFGRWMLPPDWLLVPQNPAAALEPATSWPARFSYDAIRVPLYVAWARTPMPDMLEAFGRYWSAFPDGAAPAWVDLATNTTAPFRAGPGMLAVARLATTADRAVADPAPLPVVGAAPDYYGSALILLSRIAWRESAIA